MRIYITLSWLFISGCASQYLVNFHSLDGETSLSRINNYLNCKNVKINLRDQTSIKARQVEIEQDSTCLLEMYSGYKRNISNKLIASIEYSNSSKGALDGLFVGIVGGTVMGGFLSSSGRFNSGILYLPGGLVLFSLAMGAGSGHTVMYLFPTDTSNTK